MLITSDMPVTKKGSWFLDWDKKCDPELIEVIRGTVYELAHIRHRVRTLQEKGVEPPAYLKSEMKSLHADLCRLRSVAVDYREVSTIDNLEVVGEAYIRQLKRDLPPLTFQTSVLCKRIGIARDGFYNSMTEATKYSATNFSYLDSLEYKFDKLKEPSCLMDADVEPTQQLCIAFDFNANINWLVVGQPQGRELKVVKSFFVKYERKLNEIVDDFCKYYRHHRCKRVVFYYDSTALGSNYAVNDEDFHFVVSRAFRRRGWQVVDKYIGRPMRHIEKQLLINRMFAGKAKLKIRINRENNEDLLISIQTAGVYNGNKDKRAEKLPETDSPEGRLEARTDGSDAFDTLAIGCERFPTASVSIAGIASSF